MVEPTLLREFVSLVKAGRFIEAIERFYANDVTVHENFAVTRRGIDDVLRHERNVLARFSRVQAKCLGMFRGEDDEVVIRWRFRFFASTGRHSVEMEELSHQRWSEGRIVEERFFYDPQQLHPANHEAAAQPVSAGVATT